MIYVYFVFLGFLFLYFGYNKVKIGSYSRYVIGNGFVIEFKMVDLLVVFFGVMIVFVVFFCYLYLLFFFIFVFGG